MSAMAAPAANSMAHQLHPMAIPAMPRIRPPRLLKGDPHPNNALPTTRRSPDGPPSSKWVQGKWRTTNSNAVKNKIAVQDIQVAKALRHQNHGLDIYAYRHIRTNQVVYSLTRTLQENKVLKQLLYHGKKTVPATVRNDLWTPYFSIHFPPTPAGALEGLFAFQKLRELSEQRQLSPPEDLIRATQEDIDTIKAKIGSPTTLQEMAVKDELQGKIPKLNEILPKKVRAQKLMDQKATSVADAAFVLDWILSGPSPWERVTMVAENRVIKAAALTNASRTRLARVRKEIEKKASEIRRRASLAIEGLPSDERTSLNLTFKTIRKLSMEHHLEMSNKHSSKFSDIDGQPSIDLANLKEYGPQTPEVKMSHPRMSTPKQMRTQQALVLELNKYKERTQTAKTAEDDAIKEWFQHNNLPSSEMGSLWESVASARESALDTFDTQRRIDKLSSSLEAEAGTHSATPAQTTPPQEPSDANPLQHEISSMKPDWANEPRSVKVYWADVNDGLFASYWPRAVMHGSLAPFGLAKAWAWKPQLDEEGKKIPGAERVKAPRTMEKSVHTMGSGLDDSWNTYEMGIVGQQPPAWAEGPQKREDLNEKVEVEYKELDKEGRPTGEGSEAPVGKLDENILVEEPPRGYWGRVKGFFGR